MTYDLQTEVSETTVVTHIFTGGVVKHSVRTPHEFGANPMDSGRAVRAQHQEIHQACLRGELPFQGN